MNLKLQIIDIMLEGAIIKLVQVHQRTELSTFFLPKLHYFKTIILKGQYSVEVYLIFENCSPIYFVELDIQLLNAFSNLIEIQYKNISSWIFCNFYMKQFQFE